LLLIYDRSIGTSQNTSDIPHIRISYNGGLSNSCALFAVIQKDNNVDADQQIYDIALKTARGLHVETTVTIPVIRITGFHVALSMYTIDLSNNNVTAHHMEENNGEGLNLLLTEDRKKVFELILNLKQWLQ
jgi:hypothetical protein